MDRPSGSQVLAANESSISIHAFPEDERLVQDVRRTALAMAAEHASEPELRRRVEQSLRQWYPRLTISRREDFAGLGPKEHVWYVLRDGRVRRPQPVIDRMYTALADSREVSAAWDSAMRRASEALELARRPRPSAARAGVLTDENGHRADNGTGGVEADA
jgi:hypothetical protein